MKILFKNGEYLEVSLDTGTLLRDKILEPSGAKDLQCFSDENGRFIRMIRLSEIVYIE
jgi:hypothetical protein